MERKEQLDNGETLLIFLVPAQTSKISTSLSMLTSAFQYKKDNFLLVWFFFPPNNLFLFTMEELGPGNAPSYRYAK